MLDLDVWIRIAMKYDIFVIQEKLIDFRVGETSTSSQDNARVIVAFESSKLLKHFLKIDDLDLLHKVFDLKKKIPYLMRLVKKVIFWKYAISSFKKSLRASR